MGKFHLKITIKDIDRSIMDTDKRIPCVHYWVLETPNGEMSTGECRECGEKREFRNSSPYPSYSERFRSDLVPIGKREILPYF